MNQFWGGDLRSDRTLAAVQELRPIASRLGVTLAQMAIAWVLREPNVASAIVGASRPQQVDDNASASGVIIPQDALDEIDSILAPVLATFQGTQPPPQNPRAVRS
jgi:aryl-alcohol dehydrogenase-like predicted oxidoreductase